ncbi:MAG: hypothetical protein OQK82_02040 [Candidatus Pacearchaeota archaeon]|nr:hypothetical protein [Candidatus Pacearchaeota archaeon]
MAKAKMMNEKSFAKLVKELSALGELIRTRQEEKQSVMNEFDKERDRYKKGRISEDTMKSSCMKTNKELVRIDKSVRETIMKANKLGMRIREFVSSQAPKSFMAKVSGINLRNSGTKKKVSHKKMTKKPTKITRAEIKKEIKAEKRFMK